MGGGEADARVGRSPEAPTEWAPTAHEVSRAAVELPTGLRHAGSMICDYGAVK